METVVSMLQEDAVALATGPFLPPPTPKCRSCWYPAPESLGGCRVGDGLLQSGGSRWSRSVSGKGSKMMAAPQVPLSALPAAGLSLGLAPVTGTREWLGLKQSQKGSKEGKKQKVLKKKKNKKTGFSVN